MAPLLIGAALLAAYLLLFYSLFRQRRCRSDAKLHGKTAVVTGANSGIGKSTAKDLARRGARVILACRDRQRAQAAAQEIIQETGNQEVLFMHLDLSSLQSVRSFARDFLRSESRLDLLVNNAGLVTGGRTEDGFGTIFGVNHLGHFLLTVLLLERLKASGRSRVVTVSSAVHPLGKLDFGYLAAHRDVAEGDGVLRLLEKYAHSKLCNVLFTFQLAHHLQDSQVTCYSLHPGAVRTEIGRHSPLWWKLFMWPFMLLFFVDADSGAQTSLHCALEPGIEPYSGHYFSGCAPVLTNWRKARDAAAAKKLWELSESFCGL